MPRLVSNREYSERTNPEAATAQADKKRLREEAVRSKRSGIGRAQKTLDKHEVARSDRQRAIRAGTAKGYASAAPGMGYGGGLFSALAQSGMDAEIAGIRQNTADDAITASLGQDIEDRRGAAAEYEMTAGSASADHAGAIADADDKIEEAFLDSQGYIWDDESSVFSVARTAITRAKADGNLAAAEEIRKKWLVPGGAGYSRVMNE